MLVVRNDGEDKDRILTGRDASTWTGHSDLISCRRPIFICDAVLKIGLLIENLTFIHPLKILGYSGSVVTYYQYAKVKWQKKGHNTPKIAVFLPSCIEGSRPR